MKRRTTLFTIAFALSAAAAGAQVVTIPVAPVAQQGKSSTFKQFVKVTSNMNVQGISMPLDFSLSMYMKQKYGMPQKNGLRPVVMDIWFGEMNGSFGGKSVREKAPKDLRVPSITAYFDKAGDVRDFSMPGLKAGAWKAQLPPGFEKIALGGNTWMRLNGDFEMGQTRHFEQTIPLDGFSVSVDAFCTPVRVVPVGGEPALELKLEGDIDASGAADTKKASLPVAVSGNAHIVMNGLVYLGTRTGEMVRSDLNFSLFFDVDAGGQKVAGDMDFAVGAFRMNKQQAVAMRR